MGGGTIVADAGQTVTFNGSIVTGAILDGPGGFATEHERGGVRQRLQHGVDGHHLQ